MKKFFTIISALTMSLLLASTASASCTTSATTVAFGDSNTANSNFADYGYEHEKKWVSLLQQTRPVINMGVGGNTTGMGLNRIQSVLDLKPKTVTIMFGTNDAVLNESFIPKTSWKQFEINLNSMVDKFQANGTKVVLATTLPIIEAEYYKRHDAGLYYKYGGARAFHNKYNDITRRVASEQGVALMDTYNHFLRFSDSETDEGLYASNLIDPTGTHMSPYGARIFHSNIDIVLNNAGY